MIRSYITGAAAAAIVAAAGYIWHLRGENAALLADNASLTVQVASTNARLNNIQKDKESDDAIDNLSDDDLRNVPSGWIMQAPAPMVSTEPLFCDVEDARRFTQKELDWRAANAPWNLRKDFKTNTTWDRECLQSDRPDI